MWSTLWFLLLCISIYYHYKFLMRPKRCSHCLEIALGSQRINNMKNYYCKDHKGFYIQDTKNRMLGS